jgi:pimeloyl-ACP methyl ester carboxylesterase
MPYVSNEGVRFHYEVEGHEPPLVLQHGLTSSIRRWRLCGYVEELRGDYRLILVDARGHGDSEKPHDPQAYTAELMTGDIAAVMNDLGVEKANYWGYSMGGRIGFELMRYHPSRFTSYIMGGISPYEIVPPTEAGRQFVASIGAMLRLGDEEGPEAVISLQEKTLGRAASAEEKKRLLDSDFKALLTVYQNFISWPTTDDLLPSITVPCLLYAGERDPFHDGAKEAAKHIQHASFLSVPGLEHTETFEHSDLVLPHAKRFLRSVTVRKRQDVSVEEDKSEDLGIDY